MPTGFHITKVDFANAAADGQTFSFDYKQWDEPDNAYQSIDTGIVADANGTLASPVIVGSLTSGMLYNVRTTEDCSGRSIVQNIQL